jgi:hypothetical protein
MLQKDTKQYFLKSKRFVVYLVKSEVSKTGFEILQHIWFVSNLENKKCLETSKLPANP